MREVMGETRPNCEVCQGRGIIADSGNPTSPVDCWECGGNGYVTVIAAVEPLTPAKVAEMVDAIRPFVNDGEVAHSMADAIWRKVLEAIADGTAYDPQNCAVAALESEEIDFARWTA